MSGKMGNITCSYVSSWTTVSVLRHIHNTCMSYQLFLTSFNTVAFHMDHWIHHLLFNGLCLLRSPHLAGIFMTSAEDITNLHMDWTHLLYLFSVYIHTRRDIKPKPTLLIHWTYCRSLNWGQPWDECWSFNRLKAHCVVFPAVGWTFHYTPAIDHISSLTKPSRDFLHRLNSFSL